MAAGDLCRLAERAKGSRQPMARWASRRLCGNAWAAREQVQAVQRQRASVDPQPSRAAHACKPAAPRARRPCPLTAGWPTAGRTPVLPSRLRLLQTPEPSVPALQQCAQSSPRAPRPHGTLFALVECALPARAPHRSSARSLSIAALQPRITKAGARSMRSASATGEECITELIRRRQRAGTQSN